MFTPYMSPPDCFDVTYLNTENYICISLTSRLKKKKKKKKKIDLPILKGKQTFLFCFFQV